MTYLPPDLLAQFHKTMEDALAEASKNDPNKSPAGYGPHEAVAYQQGLAAAYQHALEMAPPLLK